MCVVFMHFNKMCNVSKINYIKMEISWLPLLLQLYILQLVANVLCLDMHVILIEI